MEQEPAFLEVYDQYADAVFRHCYYRVFNRELAQDLTQEAFTKTWEYLAAGKSVDNLKAFVFRVAHNALIDWSRRKKELSLDALSDGGWDVGIDQRAKLQENLDVQSAIKILQKLEEPYQTALKLRYLSDFSPKEIAQILGESENVVSVRIHRGIKKLQALVVKI